MPTIVDLTGEAAVKPRNNFHTSNRPKRSREYWRNRAVVLREADRICAVQLDGICQREATQTDHIIPVWQGVVERLPPDAEHAEPYTITWADKAAGFKMDDVANLRAACAACNAELNYRTRPKPKPKTLKRAREKHPGLI